MTEENQQILMDYITKAADFGAEQAPLVAQELLAYGFWSSLLVGAAALAALSVTVATAARLHKKDQRMDNYSTFLSTLVACIVGLIAPLIIIEASLRQLQIQTAPRVYVLEKMADMVKSE